MEILKTSYYPPLGMEITVTRTEYQKVEIMEPTTTTGGEGLASMAWPKPADDPTTAQYSAKKVEVNVGGPVGQINFGIAITRSNR